jgi:hypothetical protein
VPCIHKRPAYEHGHKERRLAKAKMLLNKLKTPAANRQLMFFFLFFMCSNISEVHIVMATKFLAPVMVLGVISNEGEVTHTYFFATGKKPWMDRVAAGHQYVFQQDGTPVQNAKMT